MPAGRDIPAAGAGGAGRGPEAPSRGSRRQLQDRHGTDGSVTSHPDPTRSARASGNAGPGGADVPAAGPAPSCVRSWRLRPQGQVRGTAGLSWGREEQPQERGRLGGQAAAQGAGLDTESLLQGSPRRRGGAWRQQEQQEQPRCALAPMACLQHLATGLAAPVQTLSLSKLIRAASTAKGI